TERRRYQRVHRFADTVRHEPCGLVRHAERAMELVTAHAFLGRANEVRRQHPLVKRDLAALENGSDRHGELTTAVAAEQQTGAVALAGQAVIAIRAAAVRADRAGRP